MIKRLSSSDGARLTFALPVAGPVSVVGEFNDWDPAAHPMKRRSNGLRSVVLTLPPGRYSFRYLAEGGSFFDDPEADAVEPNGFGETHSVVVV
jgi:1,4-alpha-glucan branching enzyme